MMTVLSIGRLLAPRGLCTRLLPRFLLHLRFALNIIFLLDRYRFWVRAMKACHDLFNESLIQDIRGFFEVSG